MCGRGFGFGSCRPANPGLRIETWGTQWCSDLNDVLRTVANPEVPERVRVNVRTRVWVRELSARKPRSQNRDLGHPVVFRSERCAADGGESGGAGAGAGECADAGLGSGVVGPQTQVSESRPGAPSGVPI